MVKKLFFSIIVILSVHSSFAQLNMSLLGQLSFPGKGNLANLWGYVDELGNEYAIVGMGAGVSVVNVTNPSTPTQVFFAPGINTNWREIKVFGDKAYITNEGGNGLMIIDLTPLPSSTVLTVTNYTGSTYPFTTAHTLFIDENGYCYLFGANYGVKGAIILNLNLPTTNPGFEVGIYNEHYIHDGFARGDTLWAAAINDGYFIVIDVSNKANPTTIITQNTPSFFTHNTWLSDNGQTLFTTDEKSNAYVAAYDVSDLNNISEIGRVQSNPGQNVIPHNTYFLNNYIITSYYRDGLVVHDASDPTNMIEVGNYDTSPAFSGNGFNGCWGAFPFFPSGNIIASDIENGLFVLGVNYTRASFLEGNVTNYNTSAPINGATIKLITSNSTSTNVIGDYKTGVATAGTYDVVFSKIGFYPDTIFNVSLSSGNTTIVDVQLIPLIPFSFQVQVIDAITLNPVPNANIRIENVSLLNNIITNTSGIYTFTNFTDSNYTITAGKWGYNTTCQSLFFDTSTNNLTIAVYPGYYDDFSFDYNWTVSGTATTGIWEIGEPMGTILSSTQANADVDVNSDCNDEAFVTGNAGGNFTNDDVDNGVTILTSPIFDATIYSNPVINYYRWFFNKSGGSLNDYMTIKLYNGTTTATIDSLIFSSPGNSSWVSKSVEIANYLAQTNNMKIIVSVVDIPAENVVEAGFDKFEINEGIVGFNEFNKTEDVNIFPNPFNDEINIQFSKIKNSSILINVTDIMGRILKSYNDVNISDFKISNNYHKGIYLVTIYENGLLIKCQKLIKY